VLPWLKSRKIRKYMGKQDELAVIASGEALRMAGVAGGDTNERVGVYLCVGYIPFERADIEALTSHSIRSGIFSMELFSTAGIEQVNPLLTFRCLPNMPIFHVSLNFGICGPYFVTYPGIGQFYLALERAVSALRAGEIDQALVGGVADQNNFLVDFHFERQPAGRRGMARQDGAAALCLETRASAERRGAPPKAELLGFEIGYRPHDPLRDVLPLEEACMLRASRFAGAGEGELGPCSLAAALHGAVQAAGSGELMHSAKTPDGFIVASRWRLA